MKITLTDKELLQTIVEENDAEIENDTDRLLAEIQAARGQMDHISYFAFTATRKNRHWLYLDTMERHLIFTQCVRLLMKGLYWMFWRTTPPSNLCSRL